MKLREVLGVALVAVGFLALYVRWIADAFTLNGLFVSGVGLIAVVLGINYFRDGRRAERRSTPVEDVEPRYEVPTPGDRTDETLGAVGGLSPPSIRNRREFHGELRETAAETLAARGDYPSEAAADEALRTGTWTDDPVAAWFLGEELAPPLAARVRGWIGSQGQFGYGARRTIAALVEARGLSLPDEEDEDADSETDTSAGSASGDRPSGAALGGGRGALDGTGEGSSDAVPGKSDGPSGPLSSGSDVPTGGDVPTGRDAPSDGDGSTVGTGAEASDRDATGAAASDRWRLTEGRE